MIAKRLAALAAACGLWAQFHAPPALASEELRLGGSFTERAVALINDDSTEVGSVHLGVVHIVDLENNDVRAGEKAIAELGFATREELLARREGFETWSQIVLDSLPELLAR